MCLIRVQKDNLIVILLNSETFKLLTVFFICQSCNGSTNHPAPWNVAGTFAL